MFGLSFWEIGLILAVALIVLGPSKLPEMAKSLGKGLREFRKATEEFKGSVNEELYRPEAPAPIAKSEAPAIAAPATAAPLATSQVAEAELVAPEPASSEPDKPS